MNIKQGVITNAVNLALLHVQPFTRLATTVRKDSPDSGNWIVEVLGGRIAIDDPRVNEIIAGEPFKANFLTYDPESISSGSIEDAVILPVEGMMMTQIGETFTIQMGNYGESGFGYDSNARSYFTGSNNEDESGRVIFKITGVQISIPKDVVEERIAAQTDPNSPANPRNSAMRVFSTMAFLLEYYLGHPQNTAGSTAIVKDHLGSMYMEFPEIGATYAWVRH